VQVASYGDVDLKTIKLGEPRQDRVLAHGPGGICASVEST